MCVCVCLCVFHFMTSSSRFPCWFSQTDLIKIRVSTFFPPPFTLLKTWRLAVALTTVGELVFVFVSCTETEIRAQEEENIYFFKLSQLSCVKKRVYFLGDWCHGWSEDTTLPWNKSKVRGYFVRFGLWERSTAIVRVCLDSCRNAKWLFIQDSGYDWPDLVSPSVYSLRTGVGFTCVFYLSLLTSSDPLAN